MTAPVSLTALVCGKYLASFMVYVAGVAMTLVYAVVLSFFSEVIWLEVLGNVVGLVLVGAAFIAVGIFISSLTENQVIAAVGGFVSMCVLYLISAIAAVIPIDWICFSLIVTENSAEKPLYSAVAVTIPVFSRE